MIASTGSLKIADDFKLPDEAVTETFAILAKRGKGKTYTAAVLAEEMIGAGFPTIVIDPIGVWWGLRASADGKSDGLPVVIFGGDHGDVPLEDTAGELIADVLVTQRIPAVLDLSLFSKAASRRFMAAFIERLYHRNREALHVIVDEADAFAPQRSTGDAARLLGAMEDLVRRGRARGIGVTLITQRPAVLNKDVLTQAEVLIALGMTGPRDVAAIDEWVRLHADEDQAAAVKASLPALPVGTAWIWSPGWLDVLQRVKIRRRITFDSSATPKPGQRRVVPNRMADVDLAALGEQITATSERAKADDPKVLRRRIVELERELQAERSRPAPDPVIERVEVPVLAPEIIDQLEALLGPAAGLLGETQETLVKHRIWVEDQLHRLPQAGNQGQPTTRSSAPRATQASSTTGRAPVAGSATHREKNPSPDRETRPTSGEGPQLKAGARRILETLARHHPMRVTRAQLGTLAKFKITGGTFQTYWSILKRSGLIDEDGAGVGITEAGLDYIGADVGAPLTTDELREQWRTALKASARKMLDVLIDAYPNGLDRVKLAEAVDMAATGGTFQTYLGTLRRNGLVEVGPDGIRAADVLFLGGES